MNRLDLFLRIFTPLAIFLAYNSNNAQTNFWQQTNGPYGSLVYALIVDEDDHILAGTTGSGIFRSSNNRENWTALNTGTTNITARIGQKLDC